MTRQDIKKATESELITEYIHTFGWWVSNMNTGRGTDRLGKHIADMNAELIRRGILNEQQIEFLMN